MPISTESTDCRIVLVAMAMTATIGMAPARAYEAGSPGTQVQPGIAIGGTTASTPSPGLYMFDQAFTYQAHVVGPGAPNIGGSATAVNVNSVAAGFLWVPGWTFLGATYDAVLVQPISNADAGIPISSMKRGVHNTFVVPVELSWKLGQSGVFVKAGLGLGVPDGSISGANGLGGIGNPWWTFRPELILSYLSDGWNLTAAAYYESNTKNTVTDYRSGDVIDMEFAATKTFGKWTIGAVGYYTAQIGDDSSSAFYRGAINANRFNIWAAGGLVGYNFGPVQLNVWGVDEFSANASGGSPGPGLDRAGITQGFKLFAGMSYRLWAPDEPAAARRPQFFK